MQTTVKITPNDKVGYARFGCSMALSADGKTAVIGGSTDNNMAGAVWVFINSEDNWIQQGPKLVGVDGAGPSGFGASVALSADGYTLLVGGVGNAAWIFSLSDDDVWLLAQKLTGVGSFGTSVALSYDGDIALIGAQGDNNFTGAAWIYTRIGDIWNQQGIKLTAPDPSVRVFGKSGPLSRRRHCPDWRQRRRQRRRFGLGVCQHRLAHWPRPGVEPAWR